MFGMKFELKRLSSGLEVVLVPMETEALTVLVMIRAGSKDEFEGKWGVAHFLEHFVFKGTNKYPKVNDITKVIDGIGGRQNAFTWTDFTGFWVKVAKDQMEKGLDVVSQLVCEPLLPEGELAKEKGTIIQEIKMGEDSYPRKAWEVFQEIVFPDSTIGRPVIGFEKTVVGVKIKDLISFRDRWYSPKNMILVLSGNLSGAENLMEMLEEKFGSLKGKSEERKQEDGSQFFTQDSPRVSVVNKKTEQAHLVMGVRTFGYEDERVYPLWVMNQILGGNMSSRLWNEVREKRGLAYYVGSNFHNHNQIGALAARAGVKLNKVEEAIMVIKEELVKLAVEKVSEEELEMGKEGVKGGLRLDLEDSQEVAEMVAEDWVMRKGKIRGVEEIIEKVDKVSASEILKVAKEVINEKQLNLSLVGPFKSKDRFESLL